MALSGNVATNLSNGRSVTFKWTATQNTNNNTSTITWQLIGSGSSDNYIVVSELKVTIDGSQLYYRDSSHHTNCYINTVLANGTKIINHNSDGTKSFSVKVEAGIYQWAINCSGSKSFTLNTISRASAITSVNNVILGNRCNVKWTPTSSSFRYKIKFTLGNWNHTTGYINPNSTSTYIYTGYIIPVEVASHIVNSTTGTMTAYLYTYSGNTQIGSIQSKTFTVTVPSSVVPTLNSVGVTIVNSNSIINNWGVAVAGYTQVKVNATASGIQGSTINSFTISGGYNTTQNGASLAYTGGIISTSGNKTFTIVAKDSRGRNSASRTSSEITFYAYSKPSITSFVVSRSTSDATRMVVRADWDYASINGNNEVTAILQYKKSSQSAWINYGAISKNIDVVLSEIFEETSSYNFKLVISDSLSSTVQEEEFVSTIKVFMDWKANGKGFALGKICEGDGFEVGMDTTFFENIYIRLNNTTKLTLADYIRQIVSSS